MRMAMVESVVSAAPREGVVGGARQCEGGKKYGGQSHASSDGP
jgi:hypothetical protein